MGIRNAYFISKDLMERGHWSKEDVDEKVIIKQTLTIPYEWK
jgi:hypothetical protein